MIDARVMKVIDELEAFQETVDNAWNVPRDEGLLLHALVLAANCRTMVEVGTSYGFSGLFLGAAARQLGGRLHTFEIDQAKFDSAQATFAKAGLNDVITQHFGDARHELNKLAGSIDFAFLDATKEETTEYYERIADRLARRCLIVIDNITMKAPSLRGLRQKLIDWPEWTYCDVDVGNGFGLAVRTGS